jgi:RNA polymerase sigma-70 factor (ECF subfamily)
MLRKIHGLPQKEIAARLGIAEHTVEKHISYGIRLCAVRMLEVTGGSAALKSARHARNALSNEPD